MLAIGVASGLGYLVLGLPHVLALAAPATAATPDAWITTKTKLALLTTEGVSGTAMQGDPSDDGVHLAWQGGHHGGKDAR